MYPVSPPQDRPGSSQADPGLARTFIWATTVDTAESARLFRDFLMNFTPAHRIQLDATEDRASAIHHTLRPEDHQPYYPRILLQVSFQSFNSLLNTNVFIYSNPNYPNFELSQLLGSYLVSL